MASWEKFSRIVAEAKASKKLDPVGHEDADVNNDGVSDSSDSYLKKRRAAVGAAIDADKKKKVEEAKQLDPVGQEDDDINNDGDSDRTDSYLRNRRKVRSKIIQAKEEVEQIDEIAPLVAGGLALGGALAAGSAIKRAQDAAKSGVDAANKGQSVKPGTGIGNAAYGMQRRNNALNDAMKQLRQSYEQEGSLVEGKNKDDSYLETDMKKRREDNEKAVEDMKKTKGYSDMVKSARKAMGIDEENEIEEGVRPGNVEKPLDKAAFKKRRRSLAGKEISAAARERGHEGSEWHNTGRTYSPDEAKSRRAKMTDTERSARHASAVDPDNEDHSNYSADKTKDPKKLRKQKAMGEGYLQEKSLSRAQQRFFGMVRSEQEGKMENASPEVKSAAQSMTKKQAHDFAATKHEGLPEKKEATKEEFSLVDKMILEFSPLSEGKLDDLLADIRGEDDGDKKKPKSKKSESVKKPTPKKPAAKKPAEKKPVAKKSEAERKEQSKEEVKTRNTATERAARTSAAARIRAARIARQAEKEKESARTERQRERFAREDEKSKQRELQSREKERRQSEEQKKRAKQNRKSELKRDIRSAWSGDMKVGSDKRDTETAGALVSNAGTIAKGVVKTGVALGKYAWKKRQAKKEEEKQKKEEQTQKEQFSNWREEFIYEVDDQTVQNQKEKIIDVSKKKNKIEINPNMSEACGCDEKEKERPTKDMKELPTKVNLAKTKMRSAGVRNPIVMVASEENVQEFAALAPLVARLLGGAAARGVSGRIAGGAAQGSLRAKAAEFAGQKAGEMTSQKVQNIMTPQPQQSQSKEDEYYIDSMEKKKVTSEDWQSVNRKDKTDGLSQKAVNAYRRENPGSKLQTAVTEKKPTGKRAARRKSFCSRMRGMKDRLTSAETARDPDSRINKALRRWNCN